jgi:RHS repeat-associated protein
MSLSYDGNGNLLSLTDPRGNVTSYVYDNLDRLETRTDPLLHSETYQYDQNGNLTQHTDRKGQVTSYAYDSLDRVSQVAYADSSTIGYSYDAVSRLTQAADSVAGMIAYSYDSLDRTLSQATPQGTVSYTYDVRGRRTSMAVPGQPVTNYSYDAADRLVQITQGATSVEFGYDAANRRTSLTLPNGVVTEYAYNSASQLMALTYKKGATTLGSLTYEYDASGRRINMAGSYARVGMPVPLVSADYNAANQQTGFGGQLLSYDLNGNLTSDGVNAYTWNARNQLTSISGPGLSASFLYDAIGRRTGRIHNGTSTSFLYDGANTVQEQIASSPSSNILAGFLDESFARVDSLGVSISPLRDALGSSVALSDSTGAPQTHYTYEAFGGTTEAGAASTNPQKYTGRDDDGSGLYYYRSRYYSPGRKRFISEDPIGYAGGINLFAYVLNNPLSFTDPFGHDVFGLTASGSGFYGSDRLVGEGGVSGALAGNLMVGFSACVDSNRGYDFLNVGTGGSLSGGGYNHIDRDRTGYPGNEGTALGISSGIGAGLLCRMPSHSRV